VELGLRLNLIEEQDQFILHHQVMRRQTDEKVAVEIVRCPDHGIKGFERYVALAVLAKNIHRLGTVLREQQKERQRRKRGPYKKAA